MIPSKCLTYHGWISFRKKVLDVASRPLIEAKTENGQMALNFKSCYEYHMWGLQKCTNHCNKPIRRGTVGLRNPTFNYFGLNEFETNIALCPLLTPD